MRLRRRQEQGVAVLRRNEREAGARADLSSAGMHGGRFEPGIEFAELDEGARECRVERIAVQDAADAQTVARIGADTPRTAG